MKRENGILKNKDEISMDIDGIEIALVGAGGIGSNLAWALVPAIHRGVLVESLGPVKVRVYDSDKVSESNLSHQSFSRSDVGRPKAECLREALSEYEGELLSIEACPWDIRSSEDIGSPDLIVVGVDSSPARLAVHAMGVPWLDLRCAGDNYIALDSRMDPAEVDRLTDEGQSPGSCQMDGAIASGNIQFGHLAAAAHGAQWVVQSMRANAGHEGSMPPSPKASSITFGTLERMATL